MGAMRDLFRPYYSKFRPIYVPLLCSAGLLPFEAFLRRAGREARLSNFHSRYPFAVERGPAAMQLRTTDPNSPHGHEPELAHLIDLLVRDDGVFLDVGSNYGYFSIFLATRSNFHGSIHAFEPVGSSFAGLQGLVASLQCSAAVTCHQLAVSDKAGTAAMEVAGDPGLARIADGELQQSETVRTATLDSLKLDRVDFLKIDVEGHEANVLKGAEALIGANNPYIFLESWVFSDWPDKVFEPLQFLVDRGYRLYLPAWLQSNGSFFVGVGANHDMNTFALIPFSVRDRLIFPSNPINIFACPIARDACLGAKA